MSYQQINLYRGSQRAAGTGLGFNLVTVAIAAGILALLLVGLGLSKKSANSDLAEQLQNNQAQLQQIQEQNAQLQQQLASSGGADQEQQLQQAQRELTRLQQVRGLMQQQQSSRRYSFAEQLSGLAQNHINGLSLQQIHLLNGGSYLTLGGETQPAETVLKYLQKLQQDERFASARFGPLQLQRDKQRSGLVQFQLGDMPREAQP
ncbi:MAG: hypothetical protein OIF34_11325 [Porticoccaceae bacterium]|nr:hypothetical protein [Porticoccaceae bacterium]